jgi:AcrR family transcriptional regulator
MPRLWTDTLAGHRRAVRDAALDAVGALVDAQGPYELTMSAIAERAGIGRATLYRYFPDVESILVGWHERVIAAHLEQLAERADGPGPPLERLRAVLGAYAAIEYAHRDHPLAPALHAGPHHLEGRRRLAALLERLLAEAAVVGAIRDDVDPGELAAFCINALGGAREVAEPAGADRIAAVTVDALRR